jgi:hypothetical protein
MTPMHQSRAEPVESDQTIAPLVFVYIYAVVASIAAMLAWVFWFRGYA